MLLPRKVARVMPFFFLGNRNNDLHHSPSFQVRFSGALNQLSSSRILSCRVRMGGLA